MDAVESRNEAAKRPDARRMPPNDGKWYDNEAFATLLGVEVETLRNYVWLDKKTATQRRKLKLQNPPEGFPKPRRKSGRLYWDKSVVDEWIKERQSK